MGKKLEENVIIVESMENPSKIEDDTESEKNTPKAAAENDRSSAFELKKKTESSTGLEKGKTNNVQDLDETEGGEQKDPTVKQQDRETAPPYNPVKSKEAARRNILKYVGKMKAKEAEEEESLTPVENGFQEELRPNGLEVIEKSDGGNVTGGEGDEKIPVKMRPQKDLDDEKETS